MRRRGGDLSVGTLRLAMCIIAAGFGFGPVRAGAETDYRHLRIDGAKVTWRWVEPRRPATLTYGFATGAIDRHGAPTCPQVESFDKLLAGSGLELEALRAAAIRAFERWSAVIDITFAPSPPGVPPDILLGAQMRPVGTAFTSLEVGPVGLDGKRSITGGVICLNPSRRWKTGFDGDLTRFDLEHVFTHEIGHVLGLDHPGARGHVMAFRYLEDVSGLTAGDIAGAQSLYGRRERPYKANPPVQHTGITPASSRPH